MPSPASFASVVRTQEMPKVSPFPPLSVVDPDRRIELRPQALAPRLSSAAPACPQPLPAPHLLDPRAPPTFTPQPAPRLAIPATVEAELMVPAPTDGLPALVVRFLLVCGVVTVLGLLALIYLQL